MYCPNNTAPQSALLALLSPLEQANFRISSDVDVDFSQSKESLVKYGDSHVLSQDETTHIHGDNDKPIGIPGALSNEKPDYFSVSRYEMRSARSCALAIPAKGMVFPGTVFCGDVR